MRRFLEKQFVLNLATTNSLENDPSLPAQQIPPTRATNGRHRRSSDDAPSIQRDRRYKCHYPTRRKRDFHSARGADQELFLPTFSTPGFCQNFVRKRKACRRGSAK